MSIIKNIREKSGFTQAELAKKTGLSLRTIQRLRL
jgi:transcriptional regulator with XRE-family HTH domain